DRVPVPGPSSLQDDHAPLPRVMERASLRVSPPRPRPGKSRDEFSIPATSSSDWAAAALRTSRTAGDAYPLPTDAASAAETPTSKSISLYMEPPSRQRD